MNHPLLVPLLLGSALGASTATASPPPSYPGTGRILEVDFGDVVYEARFERDGRTLTFRDMSAYPAPPPVTVAYEAVEVAPRVYMLSWSKENPRATVVHIQNWNDNRVFSGMTTAEAELVRLRGSMRIIDELP